ncbi:MAG TPA: DUF359 domain-containing protein [Candidatus Poseidoniia archaeon]|nr:DUF359 domain-containing protein [Candidatus Poseidoniia archaeon]
MYILRPEMAEELRNSNRKIYQESPDFLLNSEYIVTVGDICTIKIFEEIREPNLSIIDMKTKRTIPLDSRQKIKMDKIGQKIIKTTNQPGTISLELWDSIKRGLKNKLNTKIIVEGEEDLATLAAISMADLGTKVIYGMPDRGMVVVDVDHQEKKRANSFLKRMLVD